MKDFSIPYAIPFLPSKSGARLIEAFQNIEISGGGPEIDRLEENVRNSLNAEYSLAVSNGSAALRLAFMALGLGPDSKVLLPGWGFHVAANIAYSMGATLEFVDVDLDTWCADYGSVNQERYGENDFFVLIHTLGNTSDLGPLEEWNDKRKYSIIEDSAEALFSKFKDRYLGTIFDVGTFSMHAAKTITTGEGGFLVAKNSQVFEKAKLIRSHGVIGREFYVHTLAGDNFRLSNLLAAVANPQFELKENIIHRRNEIYQRYLACLDELSPESFIQPTDPQGFFPWGFGLRIGKEFSKNSIEIRDFLGTHGIDTRPGFSSASQLPYFKPSMVAEGGTLANSDQLRREVILLPHYPSMTNNEVEQVCELILKCIR